MDAPPGRNTEATEEPSPRSEGDAAKSPRPDQTDGPREPSAELEAFAAFTKGTLQTTRSLGKDLNRHAPTYMGAFGAAIITAVLVMQAYPSDFGLSSAEFITIVAAGLIMVCLGAALVAFRLRSFERTEVAYGEQAKDILVGETLVPGSTLLAKTPNTTQADPNGRGASEVKDRQRG
jgi:hypothetical protein